MMKEEYHKRKRKWKNRVKTEEINNNHIKKAKSRLGRRLNKAELGFDTSSSFSCGKG